MLQCSVEPTKVKLLIKKNGTDVSTRLQNGFNVRSPSVYRDQKKNYKKSRIEEGIDDQRDADLMDMTKFSKFNDGVKFVLLVIYNLFKIHMYEWLRPLENNQGSSVETVLGDVLCGDRILNAKKILTGI